MRERNFSLFCSLVILVGIVVRIYLSFFAQNANFASDTYSYFLMADRIVAGDPIALVPNGYPLIVSATKYLFGERSLVVFLLTANIVMSASVILFSFLIAQTVFGTRTGYLAAAFVAGWPSQINYVRQLLSEVPATFFLLGSIVLILWQRRVFAGALLYFATMIRSSLSLIGPFFLCWLFLCRGLKPATHLIIGLLAGLCIELGLEAGGVIKAPANLGSNLLIAIEHSSTEGIEFSVEGFTPQQREQPLSTYVSFAIHNPWTFGMQRLSSLWELWGPWPTSGDSANPRSYMARILIGLRFPAVALALLAIGRSRRNPDVWFLALPIFALTIVHLMFFSTSRFTHPVEPLVLILAAASVYPLIRCFSCESEKTGCTSRT